MNPRPRASDSPVESDKGHSPYCVLNEKWRGRDLNPRPRAYESYDLIRALNTPSYGFFVVFISYIIQI